VGDLEAHGVAAVAAAHLLLNGLEEVLGFVLVVVEEILAQDAVLIGDHALGPDGDARELLGGAEPVGGGLDDRPPWKRLRGESPGRRAGA
jgi:hypothetical protein